LFKIEIIKKKYKWSSDYWIMNKEQELERPEYADNEELSESKATRIKHEQKIKCITQDDMTRCKIMVSLIERIEDKIILQYRN
jgi:hypothetical protein